MKKIIITASIILSSFWCTAKGLDSTNFMLRKPTKEIHIINLQMKSHNKELATNGALALATGVMFGIIGCFLEQERIQRNIPNGFNGYSLKEDLYLNYGMITLGVSFSTIGSIIIYKSHKK